jgi:hypothetical protein
LLTAFGPAGLDIGQDQAQDKIAGETVAAMGDRIDLEEAGQAYVPMLEPDRDLVLEQGAGEPMAGNLGADGAQQPIEFGGESRPRTVSDGGFEQDMRDLLCGSLSGIGALNFLPHIWSVAIPMRGRASTSCECCTWACFLGACSRPGLAICRAAGWHTRRE